MKKVIIDTNVLVSALISDSYPAKIISEYVFGKKVEVCISEVIYKEYEAVLKRDKFSRFPDFVKNSEIVLSEMYSQSVFFKPSQRVELISDEPDNRFLELAIASKADFLITGNTKDFKLESIGQTRIVTPKEFWELIQ